MKLTSVNKNLKLSCSIIKNYGYNGFYKAIQSKITKGFVDYSLLIEENKTATNRNIESNKIPAKIVLKDEIVVLAGVPYDDIGGGQRGAQLTRAALKTGRKVIYLYVYQKFDFEKGVAIASDVNIPNLEHHHVDSIEAIDVLRGLSTDATVLVEHPHPKLLPFVKLAKTRELNIVFDLIDDWETSLGGDWFDISTYNEFIKISDKVVGSAAVLVEKLHNKGRTDAVYIPNAANEYIFDKYKSYQKPHDLPNSNNIAIYFGSLYGEWFGWDYIESAAKINPEMDIILIGDVQTKPDMPSNVHFLGSKLIDELPAYLHYSQVALLPFIPGTISDAVSPIKVFEYIFLQKPIVTTHLPEIVNYPGIFISKDPDSFGRNCRAALEHVADDNIYDNFIAHNSWHTRLDEVINKHNSNKRISAIILMHNNENIIRRILSTITNHGKSYLKEVIVVDNASTDSGAFIVEKEFPSVKLIRNPENGCSKGRNIGAAYAKGDILAFFDSDQWFTSSSCFAEAIAILDSDASLGAISWGAGWFNSHSDLQGPIVDYMPNRGMNQEALTYGYRSDIAYLATSGMFIPTNVFKAIQGFDTFYDPTCFEDTDLAFQIKAAGFRIGYRDFSGIRHQPHQTTLANSNSQKYKTLFKRNQDHFLEKWRDYPDYFKHVNE